jgi:hypothetical protein
VTGLVHRAEQSSAGQYAALPIHGLTVQIAAARGERTRRIDDRDATLTASQDRRRVARTCQLHLDAMRRAWGREIDRGEKLFVVSTRQHGVIEPGQDVSRGWLEHSHRPERVTSERCEGGRPCPVPGDVTHDDAPTPKRQWDDLVEVAAHQRPAASRFEAGSDG